MTEKYIHSGEGVPQRHTKAYKGEGDPRSMNIEPTYFLNGPFQHAKCSHSSM